VRSRLSLTGAAFGAAGVVLGFVLGGVGPRAELVERDEEVAELERRLEAADTHGWRSPVPGFDRILRAPREREGRPLPAATDLERAEMPEGPPEPIVEAERVDGLDGGVPRPRWRERWRENTPDDRLSAFRRAASLQRVRRMQSRAALAQQGDLSDEEVAEVDAVFEEMNGQLAGHGEELLLLAMGDEPPQARDLLGITHDVTGILHRAQLRLEGILGPERATDVDPSALEIWNHVDLGQLEPAARAAIERGR
jgi:hypothetical protein